MTFEKALRSFVALLVFILVPMGCQRTQSSHPTLLRIGYLPIAECVQLYVGIAQGYFKDQGLDVQLQSMRGGAIVLPAVQQGNLDIGFSNVVSLILLNAAPGRGPDDGKWLVAVAGASYEQPEHSNHAILAMASSGFEREELHTMPFKIGLNTTRNIEELMFRRWLSTLSPQPDDFQIVELGFPEMTTALKQGSIDLAAVVEPFIEPPLRSNGFRLIARHYLDVASNQVVATYVSSKRWIDQNRTTLGKFQSAMALATDFIESHEAEAREIVGTYTRISQEDLFVIGFPHFSNSITADDLNATAIQMKEYGFIERVQPTDLMVLQ